MSTVGKTVREWVDDCCGGQSFEYDDQIRTYGERKIMAQYDGRTYAFPQNAKAYRNVMHWVLLDDGTSVGWNESPRSGWSFPRSSKRITTKYMEHFQEKGLL